jgi:hypothetical protein
MAEDEGFFSRWSRRKVQARQSEPLPEEPATPEVGHPPALTPAAVAVQPPASERLTQPEPAKPSSAPAERRPSPREPLPTLDDVRALTPDADFSRFVAPDVSPDVRNAAMKKLFSDPFFNVMDGLDIYIDDYSKPDPLPPELARKLVSSQFMKLFDEPKEAKEAAAPRELPVPDAALTNEPTLEAETSDTPAVADGPEEPAQQPDALPIPNPLPQQP